VSGRHLTIEHAAEGSHLELGIMFPILADALILSLKMTEAGVLIFADKCFATLIVNKEKCAEHLEKSTVYATLLAPIIGYDRASGVVKEAIETGKSVREIVKTQNMLSDEEFDRITGIV